MPVWFEVEAFVAGMLKLHEDLDQNGINEWERTAIEAERWMHGNGYRERTGELSRSMLAATMSYGWLDYRTDILARSPIALYVDQPTKGHWIPKNESGRTWYAGYQKEEGGEMTYLRNKRKTGVKPRRHKMLRWFVNGRPVFARRVWHPPTRGAHFMDRMADYYQDMFPINMQSMIDRTITANG